MKTIISAFAQDTVTVDLPEDESGFYCGLAKELVKFKTTPVINVECSAGHAVYSSVIRSGTILLNNLANRLFFRDNGNYPTVYLTCVNEQFNNYKFYKLEQADSKVIATYGRIGAAKGELFGERTCIYEPSMFWIKYYEKLAKGYIDQSDIYLTEKPDKNAEPKMMDTCEKTESEKLYLKLMALAKKTISRQCKSVEITIGMIKKSRMLLMELYKTNGVDEFNSVLLKLISVCPRKVWRVSELLAVTEDDFAGIIEREEDLVNAMDVVAEKEQNKTDKNDFSVYDIEVILAAEDDRKKVMEILTPELKKKVTRIYTVKPLKQNSAFDNYCRKNKIKNTKLLFHGSRNENWLSIIKNGLMLYPNAVITGKMFGNGIYFASSCEKSWGYTSGHGAYWTNGTANTAYMGLYEVAYGEPEDCEASHFYSKKELDEKNKNCVHAHAGKYLRNDEIIFYDEAAVAIRYLIEFSA